MDIFDFAMKMEEDGRIFYEKQAAATSAPELKEILLTLAEEEKNHYQYFKRLKDNPAEISARPVPTGSKALARVKNIFEEMSQNRRSERFGADVVSVWTEALRIEETSERFYKEKAAEEKDKAKKELLLKIAGVENTHIQMIDGVLMYLKDPSTFADSAQFKNFRSLEGW
jgi:rubrerythrin